MARETKTIQCYPDDDIINRRVKEYEAFGWELVNNQRCQEYDGQSYDPIDKVTTTTYSTFNKLTFSREKATPWYDEVTRLERNFHDVMDTKPSAPANRKMQKAAYAWAFFFTVVGIAILLVIGLGMGGGVIGLIGIAPLTFGLAIFIAGGVKRGKYKKARAHYEHTLDEWNSTEKRKADALMEKANKLINS